VNSRYDRDNDLQDLHSSGEQDREISLGTTTILGIFFALALLCAVFFGFGYSLGRHSAPPAATTAESGGEPEGNSSKPASGSPASPEHAGSAAQTPDAGGQADSPADVADKTQQEEAPEATKTVVYPAASEGRTAAAAKTSASRPVAGPGSPVVQVAAVSRQGDADILATALKQRGYSVSIRQVPQDKLLHVQVGPFATKKDADAMRQRLQADGYNAIVK
jgi:DedD protein